MRRTHTNHHIFNAILATCAACMTPTAWVAESSGMRRRGWICCLLLLVGSATYGAEVGAPGGLIVHVGCGDVESLARLAQGGRFTVQALDADAGRVEALRAALQAKGLYGRITAGTFDGETLPYVANLINAIVIPTGAPRVPDAEIERVLAPLGESWVEGKRSVKPWPDGLGSWPHWLHGPDNNAVTPDTAVGISHSLQWVASPLWGRHHNMTPSVAAMVSDRGRLYVIMDESPTSVDAPAARWNLFCRDGFNGIDLWRRPMPDWGWRRWSSRGRGGFMRFQGPDQLMQRLVAAGDRLYVTLGFDAPVSALDGRTGETLRTYAGTDNTATIQFKDGVLYLSRNVLAETPGKTVTAVDAERGRILWEHTGLQGIVQTKGPVIGRLTDAHLTIGRDKAFFLDRGDIGALDLGDGKEAWRRPRPEMPADGFGKWSVSIADCCTLVWHDGRVYLGQLRQTKKRRMGLPLDLVLWCLDAATGERLWEHHGASPSYYQPPDLFIAKGCVWSMKREGPTLVGLDPRTGELKREFSIDGMFRGHHHRCFRNKATSDWFLSGQHGIGYIGFEEGTLELNTWNRGACGYGIMPANGLIYLPAHACGCGGNKKLNGFYALRCQDRTPSARVLDAARLEKGPAFGRRGRGTTGAADWPVYRHDNLRSGRATCAAPARPKAKWAADLAGDLTAPTVAAGMVFVALKDRHEVCGLDAATGRVLWRRSVDGMVDSPPTYHAGRLYFGTRAGYLYGLTEDGELVWRFLAAPDRRQVTVFGQLESVWPLPGTAFMSDGKVCCVAGRSSNLDGGLFLYALDVESGNLLLRKRCAGYATERSIDPNKAAMQMGILVGAGNRIGMRGADLSDALLTPGGEVTGMKGKREPAPSDLMPMAGGLLDPSWYQDAPWCYRGVCGQMLVHDERTVFGIVAYNDLKFSHSFQNDVFSAGTKGYTVFARSAPDQALSYEQGWSFSRTKNLWTTVLPVRAECLVLTANALCLAGPPDVVDPDDPWGAFENRKGGRLLLLDRENGKTVAEVPLDSAPCFDGMAVAGGSIFIAQKNGTLACFAE